MQIFFLFCFNKLEFNHMIYIFLFMQKEVWSCPLFQYKMRDIRYACIILPNIVRKRKLNKKALSELWHLICHFILEVISQNHAWIEYFKNNIFLTLSQAIKQSKNSVLCACDLWFVNKVLKVESKNSRWSFGWAASHWLMIDCISDP